jgi:flagellar motor protein MotB
MVSSTGDRHPAELATRPVGYTDNTPVGAPLQRQGINDNLTLSSRRAGAVVSYLISGPHIIP